MADRHTIFAWTETCVQQYPGYVNISRDEQGRHTITVRSSGGSGRNMGSLEVSPEVLESLMNDLAADLFRDEKVTQDAVATAGVEPSHEGEQQ